MFTTLLHLVAPVDCLGCAQPGGYVCAECLDGLSTTIVATCYNCNRLSPAGRTCAGCRRTSALRGVTVAQRYDAVPKEMVRYLKFKGAAELASSMATIIVASLPADQFDLVLPVPAAPGRERARGYNPAARLAQGVAAELSLPCLDVLGRLSESHQVGLSRAERLKQIQGQIYARPSRLLHGAKVLLVDDVVTTGATLNECAKVLREAGVNNVWGAAFARHRS